MSTTAEEPKHQRIKGGRYIRCPKCEDVFYYTLGDKKFKVSLEEKQEFVSNEKADTKETNQPNDKNNIDSLISSTMEKYIESHNKEHINNQESEHHININKVKPTRKRKNK